MAPSASVLIAPAGVPNPESWAPWLSPPGPFEVLRGGGEPSHSGGNRFTGSLVVHKEEGCVRLSGALHWVSSWMGR